MGFKFIDLFAGIGGMRIAFEESDGQCVLTCEINEDALKTYQANFTATHRHKYIRDILKIEKSDVPFHDIAVAGFPCQPYSIAGLRKGLKDERGGDIFKAMIRVINEKKPECILFENVKGLINHDNGKTLQYILDTLKECGYSTAYKILNSMEYSNIPQNRERIFIVGFRSSKKLNSFEFPSPILLKKSIQDCLEKGRVSEEFYYDDRYSCFDEIKDVVKSRNTLYQWRRKYVRENKSNVCPTLTANMGSGGHNVPLLLDGFGIRKLTPRETANFQGFSKKFILPDISNSKLYHQFGNSVTVPLIGRIAKKIVEVL